MVKFCVKLKSKPNEKSFSADSYPIFPGVTVVSYSSFNRYLSFIAWVAPKKGEIFSPEKYLDG